MGVGGRKEWKVRRQLEGKEEVRNGYFHIFGFLKKMFLKVFLELLDSMIWDF